MARLHQVSPCRRATSETTAPDASVSSRSRSHIRPEAPGDASDQASASQTLRRRAGCPPSQIQYRMGRSLAPCRALPMQSSRGRLQVPWAERVASFIESSYRADPSNSG